MKVGSFVFSSLVGAALVVAQPTTSQAMQVQGCMHQKATQVDSKTEDDGATKSCGLIGIRIFGWGGALFGEDCPEKKVTTPAHQECRGEKVPNFNCIKEGTLDVLVKDCDCGGLILPVLDTGIPLTCNCGPEHKEGTVEDFETVNCVIVPPSAASRKPLGDR
jgi:hypothetical protein